MLGGKMRVPTALAVVDHLVANTAPSALLDFREAVDFELAARLSLTGSGFHAASRNFVQAGAPAHAMLSAIEPLPALDADVAIDLVTSGAHAEVEFVFARPVDLGLALSLLRFSFDFLCLTRNAPLSVDPTKAGMRAPPKDWASDR
jgi:hypothetical protein